jgi:hypothetical protein
LASCCCARCCCRCDYASGHNNIVRYFVLRRIEIEGRGSTNVTITGTNFIAGATVTIGGVAATGVIVDSATSIRATTPAPGSAATVDGAVTTTGGTGTGTGANLYTYVAVPIVSSILPLSGPLAGGMRFNFSADTDQQSAATPESTITDRWNGAYGTAGYGTNAYAPSQSRGDGWQIPRRFHCHGAFRAVFR